MVPTYFHSSERKRVYRVWTILKAMWSKVFWLLWTWRVYSVMAIFRMIVFKKHWKRSNYAINRVCAIFEMNTVVRKPVKRELWDWRKATEFRAQEETEAKCAIYMQMRNHHIQLSGIQRILFLRSMFFFSFARVRCFAWMLLFCM